MFNDDPPSRFQHLAACASGWQATKRAVARVAIVMVTAIKRAMARKRAMERAARMMVMATRVAAY